MSKISAVAGFAAALLIVASAAPAAAGTKDDIRNLQERMARVEQAAAAQSAATVRLSELERQNQFLTGRIEELSFQLDQANQRLNAIGAALSGEDGQPGAGAFLSGAQFQQQGPVALAPGDPIADQLSRTGVQDGPDAASVELPLDPAAAFDYASGFLLKGDYQRAKAAFELYVEAFPNHARTPDARFRLGEIHLALGENADAADVFIAHIRAYPNDPRAAEAYLKLGTAFSRLEKSDQACTVFKTMKAKFPNVSQPVRQRADLEMSRISCQ
ncbi:MAG: tol-pal system protein YbgF [Alphaproteobacteria bacterium]|nr:tol-pal system protein YbgF [Alphaproteobacteria bacterium]